MVKETKLGNTMKNRCSWVGDNPVYIAYHDEEWGVPVFNDRLLFEFLVLEGMQAGLSWLTILNKRENFRKAFANFDPVKVARFSDKRVEKLMLDAGIIRNRLKINAAIANAKVFLKIQNEFGSFADYIWGFVDGKPLVNKFKSMGEIPAKTELAEVISKDLKKRGCNFVGPTIIYAHMQATGMVNDHSVDCFRYKAVQRKANWVR